MDWNEIQQKFKPGEIIKGKITKIGFHGIHLNVSPDVPAFLPRSECLFTMKIIELNKNFQVNQEIETKIITLDQQYKDLVVSRKGVLPNPWDTLANKYKIEDIVEGEVVFTGEKHALIETKKGILGIIRISEVWLNVETMTQALLIGDKVKSKIMKIDDENKILDLSIRSMFGKEFPEKEEEKSYSFADFINKDIQLMFTELTQKLDSDQILNNYAKEKYQNVLIINPNENFSKSLGLVFETIGLKTNHIIDIKMLLKKEKFDLFILSASLLGKKIHEDFVKVNQISRKKTLLIEGTQEQIDPIIPELKILGFDKNLLIEPYDIRDIVQLLNNEANKITVENITELPQIKKQNLIDNYIKKDHEFINVQKSTEDILEYITAKTYASFIILFQIKPATLETEIYNSANFKIQLSENNKSNLRYSPISTVIWGGQPWNDISGKAIRFYKHFKCLGYFESVFGFKIDYSDEYKYALFLFGKQKNQLHPSLKQMMHEFVSTLSISIERDKFKKCIESEHKLITTGKLTSGLVHELRTQEQTVTNYIQVLHSMSIRLNKGEYRLNDKTFKAEFEDIVKDLMESHNQSNAVQRTFLDILKDKDEKEINIDIYLNNLISSLKLIANKHRIKIFTSIDKIPETYINIGHLSQIIINLFNNSIEQITTIRKRTGGIEITLSYEKKEKDLPIIIKWSDNGPGIHHKYKERVFDLLFTTKSGGTGQGLYICKTLIEHLGGTINIGYNVRMSGVTFILKLPMKMKKKEKKSEYSS
jgi:signal transduction histidine kinase/predicted RNA-binding protein with RPS1 domain